MRNLFIFFAVFMLLACTQKEVNDQSAMTPWGTVENESDAPVDQYSLHEILESGELIALTIPGEATYYTFDKAELGAHYLLCTQLAHELGVGLRVVECKDTAELVGKLRKGEGDLAMLSLSKKLSCSDSLVYCGPEEENAQWAVMSYNKALADTVDAWYQPELMAEAKEKEEYILNVGAVQCQVYEPVLDRGKGIISEWDHLFKTYASEATTDWRLLAALCYQESCFDPKAHSWAGACGLMQIMPETAASLGLPESKLFDPESNVSTAARLISQLITFYRDVPDDAERMNFVLASYNGGPGHVRDAMALTEKYGGDKYVWDEVAEYILLLSKPQYYRDAVVKCGYMRGVETHDYVYSVRERYEDYAGVALGDGTYAAGKAGKYGGVSTQPERRVAKENKYQI